mgnify:CR=1 FL=1
MCCSVSRPLQIKVRDISNMSISVSPADYPNWSSARSDMQVQNKRGLKALRTSTLAAFPEETHAEKNLELDQTERAMEHSFDHDPHNISMRLEFEYNFLGS